VYVIFYTVSQKSRPRSSFRNFVKYFTFILVTKFAILQLWHLKGAYSITVGKLVCADVTMARFRDPL